MRKIILTTGDFDLYDTEINIVWFDFYQRHRDVFKRMWAEQGQKFWINLLMIFRRFAVEFGVLKDVAEVDERYNDFVDDAFVYIQEQFVYGRFNDAKNLMYDIVIVAQHQDLIPNLESKSHVKDPFYHKDTRDVYRKLFGMPSKKESYLKVYVLMPIYLRFAGAMCKCLKRWMDAEEMDPSDDTYLVAFRDGRKWGDTVTGYELSDEEETCKLCMVETETLSLVHSPTFVMYLREKREGLPCGPRFLLGWRPHEDPRFFDKCNPLYDLNADPEADWRVGLNFPNYKDFVDYVRKTYGNRGIPMEPNYDALDEDMKRVILAGEPEELIARVFEDRLAKTRADADCATAEVAAAIVNQQQGARAKDKKRQGNKKKRRRGRGGQASGQPKSGSAQAGVETPAPAQNGLPGAITAPAQNDFQAPTTAHAQDPFPAPTPVPKIVPTLEAVVASTCDALLDHPVGDDLLRKRGQEVGRNMMAMGPQSAKKLSNQTSKVGEVQPLPNTATQLTQSKLRKFPGNVTVTQEELNTCHAFFADLMKHLMGPDEHPVYRQIFTDLLQSVLDGRAGVDMLSGGTGLPQMGLRFQALFPILQKTIPAMRWAMLSGELKVPGLRPPPKDVMRLLLRNMEVSQRTHTWHTAPAFKDKDGNTRRQLPPDVVIDAEEQAKKDEMFEKTRDAIIKALSLPAEGKTGRTKELNLHKLNRQAIRCKEQGDMDAFMKVNRILMGGEEMSSDSEPETGSSGAVVPKVKATAHSGLVKGKKNSMLRNVGDTVERVLRENFPEGSPDGDVKFVGAMPHGQPRSVQRREFFVPCGPPNAYGERAGVTIGINMDDPHFRIKKKKAVTEGSGGSGDETPAVGGAYGSSKKKKGAAKKEPELPPLDNIPALRAVIHKGVLDHQKALKAELDADLMADLYAMNAFVSGGPFPGPGEPRYPGREVELALKQEATFLTSAADRLNSAYHNLTMRTYEGKSTPLCGMLLGDPKRTLYEFRFEAVDGELRFPPLTEAEVPQLKHFPTKLVYLPPDPDSYTDQMVKYESTMTRFSRQGRSEKRAYTDDRIDMAKMAFDNEVGCHNSRCYMIFASHDYFEGPCECPVLFVFPPRPDRSDGLYCFYQAMAHNDSSWIEGHMKRGEDHEAIIWDFATYISTQRILQIPPWEGAVLPYNGTTPPSLSELERTGMANRFVRIAGGPGLIQAEDEREAALTATAPSDPPKRAITAGDEAQHGDSTGTDKTPAGQPQKVESDSQPRSVGTKATAEQAKGKVAMATTDQAKGEVVMATDHQAKTDVGMVTGDRPKIGDTVATADQAKGNVAMATGNQPQSWVSVPARDKSTTAVGMVTGDKPKTVVGMTTGEQAKTVASEVVGGQPKAVAEPTADEGQYKNDDAALKVKKQRDRVTCAHCQVVEPKPKTYKKCQKCRELGVENVRYYCSRDCQAADWMDRHRAEHQNNQLL